MLITAYIPLCDAIVLLMQPLVEVVIHDIDADSIFYINGGLSGRKKGDPSLLGTEPLAEGLDTIVYPKLNFDGRLIKSISVPIEDKWLICINCDISIFNQMKALTDQVLQVNHDHQPEGLFKNDWQEKLHIAIHEYLGKKNWAFDALKQQQKKEVIEYLFLCGAFNEKKAADYVAKTLSLGRATVFNYLKEWRDV